MRLDRHHNSGEKMQLDHDDNDDNEIMNQSNKDASGNVALNEKRQ